MFGKRKLEHVVDELERSVKALKNRNDELTVEVGRLERILKYSGDAPSCRFITTKLYKGFYQIGPDIGHKLYIYVDKNEYIIEIDNLPYFATVFEDDYDFSVSGDQAYFDISVVGCKDVIKRYCYTIDYANGKYVTSIREDEERTEAYKAKMKGEEKCLKRKK